MGFDQGGLLTEAINKHPHAVLLLDEIEKAHPDVFNLLLQVMDHGTLTDNNGRKADFRNVILVMTTNAGADRMSRPSIGFTVQDHSGDGLEAIQRMFSPEFRNRLDSVVQFAPLGADTIAHVVDKFIIELEGQLEEKRVILEVDEEARAWLAEHGFDALMGARPMARIIQEHIKRPLADELLFGRLEGGGHVKVTARDGALAFEYERKRKNASGSPAESRRFGSPEPAPDGSPAPRLPACRALASEIGDAFGRVPIAPRYTDRSAVSCSSRGNLKITFSSIPPRVLTVTSNVSRRRSIRPCTSDSGADAPAVIPTVRTPSSHAGSRLSASGMRWLAVPASSPISRSRLEFEL